MRVHFIQFVPFEGLGYLQRWVKVKKAVVTLTKIYENLELPNIEDVDMIVLLGAPLDINEKDERIEEVKRYIEKALVYDKAIFGSCFGALLIANVLNAKIHKGKTLPLKWLRLNCTLEALDILPTVQDILSFYDQQYIFEAPFGATRILYSEDIGDVAFLYKKNVIAVLPHLEINMEWMKQFLESKHFEPEELSISPLELGYDTIETLRITFLHSPTANFSLNLLLNFLERRLTQ